MSCTNCFYGNLVKQLTVMLCCLATAVVSAPISSHHKEVDGLAYLSRYHYLGNSNPDPSMASLTDPGTYRKALMHLQQMGHINVTGEMDDDTVELMNMPRCGNADNVNMGSMTRKRRYVIQGSMFGKKDLTYKFLSYTNDMPTADLENEIAKAFQVWADVTPLTFTKVTSGKADIDISFVTYDHNDGNPFDGPGGTLAHAFFPVYGGDAHFDDSETFTFNTYSGTNLFQVAAHEFGHSLGLSHSSAQNSLMAPFYRGYNPTFMLDSDDIRGIQGIYGPPTDNQAPAPTVRPVTNKPAEPTTTTTQAPTKQPQPGNPESPDYCRDGQFDAIISLDNSNTYGFRGSYYYKIGSLEVEQTRPITDWPGLPANLDAAISFPPRSDYQRNYNTYRWEIVHTPEQIWFFKDRFLYKYDTQRQSISDRELISSAIPGLPDNVDSAFRWSGNGRTYITKGAEYYRLNEDNTAVEPGYPRDISVWTIYSSTAHKQQLAQGIDAAFQYSNGRTYFFVGPNYYRFNDVQFTVDRDYPRSVAVWWYGCESANLEQGDVGDEMSADNGIQAVDPDNNDTNTNTASITLLLLSAILALTH